MGDYFFSTIEPGTKKGNTNDWEKEKDGIEKSCHSYSISVLSKVRKL